MNQKSDHAPVVVNPFLIYIGLGVVAILLQQVLPLYRIPSLPAHIAGLSLVAVNFVFGLPALRGMFQAKTSPNPGHPSTSLVVSGIYRLTRNPMYIGLTLVFTGLLIYFQISWGLVFAPIVIWLITKWVIFPEEQYLEYKFGEDYRQYKSMVRRWI